MYYSIPKWKSVKGEDDDVERMFDGLICNSDQLGIAPCFFSSPGWQFEYCLN